MPDSTVPQQLVRLARASSRSAEALGRALVVLEDEDWQEQLRQTYPERVELFEMCVRCLVAADTSPSAIRQSLYTDPAPATPAQEDAIDEVLTTELVLETELQHALQRDDWRDVRMPEILALHLLRSQSFRSECVTLAQSGSGAGLAAIVGHGMGLAERLAA